MKRNTVVLAAGALMLASCSKQAPAPQPAPEAAPPPPPAVAAAPTITPVDVPAGYGYPGNRTEFQAWADTWQINNITTAAWNLWAGMTSDSGQKWNGAVLPVWETWCGTEEVFSATGCTTLSKPGRRFERPHQFGHVAKLLGKAVKNDEGQVVSFNKFNPPMVKYLNTPQPGPGGANYNYVSMQSLASLNAAWPAETPISQRTVVEAPYQPDEGSTQGYTGMETKPVIFIVKANGLTPMPLWMGPKESTNTANSTPNTWYNCVLLDPTAPADPSVTPVPATPEQIAQAVASPGLSCKNYLYAPLATIYNFQLNAAEAADWNNVANNSGDSGQGLIASAGDYGVLVGMHVNSKTIKNWTWETFWWQPGKDAPNNFPGSKSGITDNVTGAWRNYAMCTAWHQTQGAASSKMVVCFNPYLETSSGIPAGQSSNCMSCHGVATVGSPLGGTPEAPVLPSLNYPPDYKKPINFDTDPRFSTFTKTDFSWAIQGDAINLPTPAAAAKP